MNDVSREFRVFLSSTFRDFVLEREYLRANIFNAIGEECREQGFSFSTVDLRWGISETAWLNQNTSAICLEEIERCQEISPNLNFVVFIGQYYGWQPLSDSIPVHIFEKLYRICDRNELLNKAYVLDENNIPAEYVLRHISDIGEGVDWFSDIEEPLRQSLQAAYENEPDEELVPYAALYSMTYREIDKGLLDAMLDAGNVFCLFRTINNSDDDVMFPGSLPETVLRLREEIAARVPAENILTVDLDKSEYSDAYLQRIGNWLYESLSGAAKDIMCRTALPDETTMEVFSQAQLLKAARNLPVAFDLSGLLDAPVSVLSIPEQMPELAIAIEAKQKGKTCIRFVSETPGSESLRDLLLGITQELCPTLLQELAAKDENGLMSSFYDCIAGASEQVTLIMYGFDRLTDFWSRRRWRIFSQEPPAGVKLIFITGSDSKERLSRYGVSVADVSAPDARALLTGVLDSIQTKGRTLSGEQQKTALDYIEADPTLSNVKMFLPKALTLRSCQKVDEWFEQTRQARLSVFLKQFCGHLPEVADAVLAFLSAARDGLAREDILYLLKTDETVMRAINEEAMRAGSPQVSEIPPVIYSRILADLRPYLRRGGFDGIEVLRLDAETDVDLSKARESIISYTEGKDGRRALREYTWQLYKAGRGETLRGLLTDATFIKRKLCALPDLISDYDRCLQIISDPLLPVLRERLSLLSPILQRFPEIETQTLYCGLVATDDIRGLEDIKKEVEERGEIALACLGGDPFGVTGTVTRESGSFIGVSPDGELLLAADGANLIAVDARTFDEVFTLTSPIDGARILKGVLSNKGTAAVMDAEQNVYFENSSARCDSPLLLYSENGGVIVTCEGSLCSLSTGGARQLINEGIPLCVSVWNNNLAAVYAGKLHIFVFNGGEWVRQKSLDCAADVRGVSFSQDGRTILLLSLMRRVIGIDIDTEQTLFDLRYTSEAGLPLTRIPCFCGQDDSQTIYLTDAESNSACYHIDTQQKTVYPAGVDANHPRITPVALSVRGDAAVLVLPMEAITLKNEAREKTRGHVGGVSDLGFLESGEMFTLMKNDSYIYTYGDDGELANSDIVMFPQCATSVGNAVAVGLANRNAALHTPGVDDLSRLQNLPFQVSCEWMDFKEGTLFLGSKEGFLRTTPNAKFSEQAIYTPEARDERFSDMAAINGEEIAFTYRDHNSGDTPMLAITRGGRKETIGKSFERVCTSDAGQICTFGSGIQMMQGASILRPCREACFIGERLIACSFLDTPMLEILNADKLTLAGRVFLPDIIQKMSYKQERLLCGLRNGKAALLDLTFFLKSKGG